MSSPSIRPSGNPAETARHRSQILLILVVGILVAATSGCLSVSTGGESGNDISATQQQKHTFLVGEVPTIIVSGFNGSIEVTTGDDGAVDVEADIRVPGRVSYSATIDGNTVSIISKKIGSGITIGRSPGVEIKLVVPERSVIDARTSNGSVTVDGISGNGELATSNGRITLTRSTGAFTTDTSNGRIVLNGVNGQFNANTSNGSIEFTGSLSDTSVNEFSTSNGSIVVEFTGADEPNVSIDARTSNGSARSDRPILVTITEKSRLVGKFGEGSASLDLLTSNGSIVIR
ncbi:MAG: DUF4097 family beta strand repeat-containing protein [Chloroflexi bacterium]|nr:DUF4097 family beta strand repeat-containing protein [Chloroflexota bacterium]